MEDHAMNTVKNIFLTADIILLLIGAWPLAIPSAIIALVIFILKPKTPKVTSKKTIEELKKENEVLRNELADQAVRRAMDKAEKRKED